MLSNVYLHYVLDLWFERAVKPRLRGEAYMIRYIDDFVMCFQYREDALRVQDALCKRLGKFGLTLEPTKTKLVEFGRVARTRHAVFNTLLGIGARTGPAPYRVLIRKAV